MESKLPKAQYQGEVNLNGFVISCVVLDDGTRLFSERGLASAFGIKGGGAYWEKKKESKEKNEVLPEYISANYLEPFISLELKEKLKSAVPYVTKTGVETKGIDVAALADICDVYVSARNNGLTYSNLIIAADNAYSMIKAFAKVGIIALVDEATGYQDFRMKGALQKILDQYLMEDAKKYQVTFPLELYKQWFKLNNWPWKPENAQKRPQIIGKWTNIYIYGRMAPGLLTALETKNPKNEKGHRDHKHFQFLTEEVGEPKLREFFGGLIALAKASTNWNKYVTLVERVYPLPGDQMHLFNEAD